MSKINSSFERWMDGTNFCEEIALTFAQCVEGLGAEPSQLATGGEAGWCDLMRDRIGRLHWALGKRIGMPQPLHKLPHNGTSPLETERLNITPQLSGIVTAHLPALNKVILVTIQFG